MASDLHMKSLVLTLLLLLLPAASWAADDRQLFGPPPTEQGVDVNGPMTFSPAGKRAMWMYGLIAQGDAKRFREALDTMRPEEVWLASGGGNLEEGIEIGRMLRSYKLTTRVPKGSFCVSACNFIFLGGIVRYVDTGAEFGVHVFALSTILEIRIKAVREPPQSLLEFAQAYPNHKAITPDGFRNDAIAVSAKLSELRAQAMEAHQPWLQVVVALGQRIEMIDFVKAIAEWRYDDPGHEISCPGTKSAEPPGQGSPVQQVRQQQPAPPPRAQSQPKAQQSVVDLLNSMRNGNTSGLEQPGPSAAPQQQQPQLPPQQHEEATAIVDYPGDPCLEGALHHYLEVEAMVEEVKNLQQNAVQTSAEIAQFLTQMGVSLRFLTEWGSIPNDKPRPLTREEMHSLNVINVD